VGNPRPQYRSVAGVEGNLRVIFGAGLPLLRQLSQQGGDLLGRNLLAVGVPCLSAGGCLLSASQENKVMASGPAISAMMQAVSAQHYLLRQTSGGDYRYNSPEASSAYIRFNRSIP
jgi:hypothetical protein